MISFFFLGIEELAIQLEEPFSILPLHIISDSIGKSAEEHVEWHEKDAREWAVAPQHSTTSSQQPTSTYAPTQDNSDPDQEKSTTDQYASLADALRAMTSENN
jgi:hypothetical protein